MITLHDIFHFEGYWSIFQSLICRLKPVFDVCQMIIFWSLFLGARGCFEVKCWSDQKWLYIDWKILKCSKFHHKKVFTRNQPLPSKKSFFAVSINMNRPVIQAQICSSCIKYSTIYIRWRDSTYWLPLCVASPNLDPRLPYI